MGHNINLKWFGFVEVKCPRCSQEVDINECDIDCDLSTHHPWCFTLSFQCYDCEYDFEKEFKINCE